MGGKQHPQNGTSCPFGVPPAPCWALLGVGLHPPTSVEGKPSPDAAASAPPPFLNQGEGESPGDAPPSSASQSQPHFAINCCKGTSTSARSRSCPVSMASSAGLFTPKLFFAARRSSIALRSFFRSAKRAHNSAHSSWVAGVIFFPVVERIDKHKRMRSHKYPPRPAGSKSVSEELFLLFRGRSQNLPLEVLLPPPQGDNSTSLSRRNR